VGLHLIKEKITLLITSFSNLNSTHFLPLCPGWQWVDQIAGSPTKAFGDDKQKQEH